jgi:AraC-like DNA-binding protein
MPLACPAHDHDAMDVFHLDEALSGSLDPDIWRSFAERGTHRFYKRLHRTKRVMVHEAKSVSISRQTTAASERVRHVPSPNSSLIHTSGLIGLSDFVEKEFGTKALERSYCDSGLSTRVERLSPGFIPETAIVRFLASAARLMGNEAAGLFFASNVSFETYGQWGRYLAQSETLGECLARLRRIVPLHTPYDGVRIHNAGDKVWLRQCFPCSGEPEYRHLAWATLGIFVDLCRGFIEPGWQPLEIEVDLPRPPNRETIEQVFPVPIRYDAPDLGIAIHPAALTASRPRAQEATVTFGDVLRERGPRRNLGFVTAVEEAMQVQVRAGQISIENTARMFDMSTRRFQRLLDQESLSFRQISSAVKIERACALLSETSLPIKAVAAELGYRQVPSFTRAFTLRMNTSPTNWRRSKSVARN